MKKITLLLAILFVFISSTVFGGPRITGQPHPPSQPLVTGQTTSYHADDGGDLERGVSRDYVVLTTGQYSGTSNITINGKTHALSNECVQDNRTGLMWARYVPDADIGPAADGKLFWDQYTIAGESVTFATVDDSITAAAGTPFNVGALCVGRKIAITGTANNNVTVTVTAILNNKITCAENLTDEGPVATNFATVDDLVWDLKDQANTNSLGGYTDWRVPNRIGMESLLEHTGTSPFMDSTVFPSATAGSYWCNTTNPIGTTDAFYVSNSSLVSSYVVKKTTKLYLRLVRGGPN